MKRFLTLLAACLLLAAGPGEKVQLRCRLPVGTAWDTKGTLLVVTTVSENGHSKRQESKKEISWQEKVVESNSIQGVTKETVDGPQVLRFLISPRAEQRPLSVDGEAVAEVGAMMVQPALFPLPPVAVGDVWDIKVQDKLMLRGERARIPADYSVQGTGTFSRVENGLAALEFALSSELRGSTSDAEGPLVLLTTSTTKWTLNVEPATGFVASQALETTTDQSMRRGAATVGPAVHTVTTMSLQSQRIQGAAHAP